MGLSGPIICPLFAANHPAVLGTSGEKSEEVARLLVVGISQGSQSALVIYADHEYLEY